MLERALCLRAKKYYMLNYPLKFISRYEEKIWGGNRLNSVLHKASPFHKTGESWEISAVKGKESIIENGDFAGKTLRDICFERPLELLGNTVSESFNGEFPLLIKYLDSNVPLSVQVHPDDELAKKYSSLGKNEMWYILDAEEDSSIYLGFEQNENRSSIEQAIQANELMAKIKTYQPKKGDVFHIPARTIHAIGKEVLLAEIQQTSDITFRLYDWDRTDKNGNERDLHIEESLNVLNYKETPNLYLPKDNRENEKLVHNDYFKTNEIKLNTSLHKNTQTFNSFVIYMCLNGEVTVHYGEGSIILNNFECVLLPFALGEYSIESSKAELLEVYV